jgi:hypothetical protein
MRFTSVALWAADRRRARARAWEENRVRAS